ncbi:MAG TPA: hypothetical protein VK963_02730, partial [Candidatus Saccharimonadales bacterium]|nr:hypothetical protein [Candidatus Saccharimonadales bacterium]
MAHISFKPLLQRLKIKTKPVRTGPLTVSRRFSKPTLLALVAILALVGVVVVARSLAGGSLDTPRGANQLVLELTRGDEEVELKDGLKPYEPIPFRLYGNGLALCGQNKDTETNQPYLASTNLSQVQIADLVRQIQSTGFLKLQDEYSLTDAKAFQLQTAVRLNLSR